jgi:hypothetical protein
MAVVNGLKQIVGSEIELVQLLEVSPDAKSRVDVYAECDITDSGQVSLPYYFS